MEFDRVVQVRVRSQLLARCCCDGLATCGRSAYGMPYLRYSSVQRPTTAFTDGHHSGMDATVAAGVIGLIGAVIGSTATVTGIIYQQRHTTRMHAASLQRSTVHTAAQTLLREILDIQEVLRRSLTDLSLDDASQRARRIREHLAIVLTNAQWLPSASLRQRLQENAAFVNVSPADDHRSSLEKRVDAMHLCADSITCLGAYIRDEPIPDRPSDVEDIVARWPDLRSATWFIEN
ncbi:hypothetical protein [Streptomyces scabiei]|uniref:hypothetical protein n=1 Tax=Streptomyces scabiei TaxID=1930 RepID=UPI0004E666BB|nr:hypothetical protein [Streptomyces scabiei]KFG10601.1 hypothetical protein IQ61_01820 [Streptomyces scabiei]MDX2837324.1 hypothetical protein [Streptomyces scabiei]MDX3681881.1 hypothetical protein [Streptomyces scabiei]